MSGESMREQLESAFDQEVEVNEEEQQEETGGSGEEEPKEPLGAAEASAEETGAEAEAGKEPVGEPEGEGAPTGEIREPEGEGEPTGEIGEPVLDDAVAKGDAGAIGGGTPAPVSWKPAVREHWDTLPPEVQQEVKRRETEIQRGLQTASGHKRVAEEYYRVFAPFQPFIQAAGSTPAQTITELMTTAVQLTQGSPAKKAEVVRNIINEYGVDIRMLDDALAGGELPQDQNAPLLRSIDERLAPINQFMGEIGGMRQQADQAVDYEAADAVDSFAEGHEYYEDLRDDMADLMEMAANRNRGMSLDQAYDRAAQAHPDIGPILLQRKNAEQGKIDADALRKKKNAASSISGSPTGQKSNAAEGTIRATMEELWDDSESSVGHG